MSLAALGLPADASATDVGLAFRRLARERHPDRGGSSEGFQEAVVWRDLALAEIEARPCPVCGGKGYSVGPGFGSHRLKCADCDGKNWANK